MDRNEYRRQYRDKHKHPCCDCGKLVHKNSTRCPECQLKELHRTNPRSPLTFSSKAEYLREWHKARGNRCLDCGKPITKYAEYCKNCVKKGERNPTWHGGKLKTPYGYIKLLRPKHPRADSKGYVFEHIVVWEEAHGKPLPAGWEVHHLNGIHNDNKPRNLEGLPSGKHKLILVAKAKRIQELEALLNNQYQLL